MTLSPTAFKAVRLSGAVPGADYLLEVDQVRKEFPGVVALDNVTLRVRPGTVHALMGENGAGKSTLMKIIAGVYQPDAGEMRLKGQPIRIKTPLDALEAGIAMIHQELNLMPFMTVAENIWIRREPLTRLGFVDHKELNRRTADLFGRLNIDISPEEEVRNLSIASRQMVEIAKAVSYESDVLIMDEPTSALTEREVDHLFAIIAALKAEGKGDHLHHPQDERGFHHRRRRFGVPRRPIYRARIWPRRSTATRLIHMMVGREITQMFPKETVPIGEVVLSVHESRLGRRLLRHLVRSARGRNPRDRRPRRRRDAPTWPRRSSA